jgi:hypothetical protein
MLHLTRAVPPHLLLVAISSPILAISSLYLGLGCHPFPYSPVTDNIFWMGFYLSLVLFVAAILKILLIAIAQLYRKAWKNFIISILLFCAVFFVLSPLFLISIGSALAESDLSCSDSPTQKAHATQKVRESLGLAPFPKSARNITVEVVETGEGWVFLFRLYKIKFEASEQDVATWLKASPFTSSVSPTKLRDGGLQYHSEHRGQVKLLPDRRTVLIEVKMK